MKITHCFPTGIVTGFAFCNRENERELLARRFEQNAHVVLMSPRRYGKSSLIAQFTLDQKCPTTSIDLLPATSSKYVRNAVVDAVSALLDAMLPKMKKTKEQILGYFSNFNPVIELSAFGQKIKLTPQERSDEETIMKLLLNLDKAAGEFIEKIIFVMDEFQQIANLENAHALEACIRHAVERSQHVFYIFSGSNRALLEAMFKSKDRPLYHLCDEIKIHRIHREDYAKFIKKATHSAWEHPISKECIERILSLTECHPYYVNRLCRTLWDRPITPDEDAVDSAWTDFVSQQKSDWVAEAVGNLSINQRTILAALAKEPTKEINGSDFANRVLLSSSSIRRTIQSLEKMDYVFQDDNGRYQVLNPVIKTYLYTNPYFD